MSLGISAFYPDPITTGQMSGAVGGGPSLAEQLAALFAPAAAPGDGAGMDGLDELFAEVELWLEEGEDDNAD